MSTLHIDGDLIVYRAGFAMEKTLYCVTRESRDAAPEVEFYDNAKDAKASMGDSDLLWNRKDLQPLEDCLELVDTIIKGIQENYEDHDAIIHLSPTHGNFRDDIATRMQYKGGRGLKPTHYDAIRKHLSTVWDARTAVGQEADDAIGIGMRSGDICVSFDKDLKQLAGIHYDWTTRTEDTISPGAATRFFYAQVLAGDATDNVPGIEGCGPKTAYKLLDGIKSHKESWNICLQQYTKKYGDKALEYAIETARLVYIRRKDNEIWSPPT